MHITRAPTMAPRCRVHLPAIPCYSLGRCFARRDAAGLPPLRNSSCVGRVRMHVQATISFARPCCGYNSHVPKLRPWPRIGKQLPPSTLAKKTRISGSQVKTCYSTLNRKPLHASRGDRFTRGLMCGTQALDNYRVTTLCVPFA